VTRDHEADCCIGWLNSAFGLMRESGGKTAALQTRLAHSKIVARANGVLPVAECFTARRLRVSVFSRTAIHAPGGWALIENLPNVLTGDRVTVGLSSTVTPSLKIKLRFSLHERSVVFVAQGCCASHQGTGKNGCASCGGVPV
jgi:hypothetical protein